MREEYFLNGPVASNKDIFGKTSKVLQGILDLPKTLDKPYERIHQLGEKREQNSERAQNDGSLLR